MSDHKELIVEARGKYKSLDGVVVVSPRLLAQLADALELAEGVIADIKMIPHWHNRETGEGGFDVDGDEWRMVRDILSRLRPRYVTTVEEIDALPEETVIRTSDKDFGDKTLEKVDGEWHQAGVDLPYPNGRTYWLPATVLYTPEPTA